LKQRDRRGSRRRRRGGREGGRGRRRGGGGKENGRGGAEIERVHSAFLGEKQFKQHCIYKIRELLSSENRLREIVGVQNESGKKMD